MSVSLIDGDRHGILSLIDPPDFVACSNGERLGVNGLVDDDIPDHPGLRADFGFCGRMCRRRRMGTGAQKEQGQGCRYICDGFHCESSLQK